MIAQETTMTEGGLADLKTQLDELVSVRRPRIAARIKEARELGDLKENAEYHDAKNEQSFIETKIMQIEERIRSAKIVTDVTTDHVQVGTAVRVREDDGSELTYTITGPVEADPAELRVSIESPIGSALSGARVGDTVVAQLPVGALSMHVVSIEPAL